MHVPKHRLIPVKISMSYGNIKTMAARKKVKTNIKGCWMRVKGKFRCDISSSMASPAIPWLAQLRKLITQTPVSEGAKGKKKCKRKRNKKQKKKEIRYMK